MVYLKVMSAFIVFLMLALVNASVSAETLFTRLECEALDGTANVWIHSKVLAFDNGKPARVQTDDPQEMAAQIMEDLYGNDTDTVIAEHAEPFRKILATKYGMLCKSDVLAAMPNRTITVLEENLKLSNSVWIDFRKDFFNVDLKILVIAYPEK